VQASRQDSKIRDMGLELEERARLLARTKVRWCRLTLSNPS